MIDIDQPVVGWVGLVEHREPAALLTPGKFSAVHDDPAQRRAMTAHELGERMNDDVGPPVEWPQQDRRCHGVVDDQRHAVAVRDRRERLDVTDIAGGIANALTEHRPGVVIDQ